MLQQAKTITIFRTHEDSNGTKSRQTLRKVTPSLEFEGFSKSGQIIHDKVMTFIKDLEPTATGYYTS